METINVPLSDLIKYSAKQLCYLRKNKSLQLNKHHYIIQNKLTTYYNMRGVYKTTVDDLELNIMYVLKELQVNDLGACIMEFKNTPGIIPLWYRQYAILQSATYQAFVKLNDNTVLQTASYAINDGATPMEFDIENRYIRSELHIGTELFNIYVSNSKKLVQYYIDKAIASMTYNTANKWDKIHKHKGYDSLNNVISYRSNDSKSA